MTMETKIIEDLIDKAVNTIVNSVDEEGYPISRAMLSVRKRVDLKEFYFSTNTPTNKVQQFRANSKASIYFFDSSRYIGCLLKGNMQVLDDMESRKIVWRIGDEAYYPGGIEDPGMVVLKFTAESMRVYSNFQTQDMQP